MGDIKAGQIFKSNPGRFVTITAVCGNEVYYKDSHGCHFHKNKAAFFAQYIGGALCNNLTGAHQ